MIKKRKDRYINCRNELLFDCFGMKKYLDYEDKFLKYDKYLSIDTLKIRQYIFENIKIQF